MNYDKNDKKKTAIYKFRGREFQAKRPEKSTIYKAGLSLECSSNKEKKPVWFVSDE